MTTTHFLAGLIFIGTVAALAVPDATTTSGPANVIDGDTFQIADKRIRLWGIDAPERAQPLGQVATERLRWLVSDAVVTCYPHDTDKYGRVVAKCSVANRDLGLSMVSAGLALDYTRYSRGYYRYAQEAAKAERLGIWAGAFETPENYRRAHKNR